MKLSFYAFCFVLAAQSCPSSAFLAPHLPARLLHSVPEHQNTALNYANGDSAVEERGIIDIAFISKRSNEIGNEGVVSTKQQHEDDNRPSAILRMASFLVTRLSSVVKDSSPYFEVAHQTKAMSLNQDPIVAFSTEQEHEDAVDNRYMDGLSSWATPFMERAKEERSNDESLIENQHGAWGVPRAEKKIPFHSKPVDQPQRPIPYFATPAVPTATPIVKAFISAPTAAVEENVLIGSMERRQQVQPSSWGEKAEVVFRNIMLFKQSPMAFFLETSASTVFTSNVPAKNFTPDTTESKPRAQPSWAENAEDMFRNIMMFKQSPMGSFLETTASTAFQAAWGMARDYHDAAKTRKNRPTSARAFLFIPRPPVTPPKDALFEVQSRAAGIERSMDDGIAAKNSKNKKPEVKIGSGMDFSEIDNILMEVESVLEIAEAACN